MNITASYGPNAGCTADLLLTTLGQLSEWNAYCLFIVRKETSARWVNLSAVPDIPDIPECAGVCGVCFTDA